MGVGDGEGLTVGDTEGLGLLDGGQLGVRLGLGEKGDPGNVGDEEGLGLGQSTASSPDPAAARTKPTRNTARITPRASEELTNVRADARLASPIATTLYA